MFDRGLQTLSTKISGLLVFFVRLQAAFEKKFPLLYFPLPGSML